MWYFLCTTPHRQEHPRTHHCLGTTVGDHGAIIHNTPAVVLYFEVTTRMTIDSEEECAAWSEWVRTYSTVVIRLFEN